jgi:hypothetical protein
LAPDTESLVCMPSMCGGRLSRGFAESTAVMKLKRVRLDEAEQTTAGRTKVLRTGCADNAQVRLVSAGWAGRQIARRGETTLELSVDATQKKLWAN